MESVYMWDYLNHYPVTRKKVESKLHMFIKTKSKLDVDFN